MTTLLHRQHQSFALKIDMGRVSPEDVLEYQSRFPGFRDWFLERAQRRDERERFRHEANAELAARIASGSGSKGSGPAQPPRQ